MGVATEIKKNDKKTINGWAFYDWANSSYPLVITTAIFPIFYESATSTKVEGEVISDMVSFFGMNFKNTELYSYIVALSFVFVCILSPLLSGIADYSDSKKKFLKFFSLLGSLSCASLYFFDSNYLEISMVPVLLASVGFWASLVFYNAYLPEIASPDRHDKVSAKGFSLGYLGASILLIVCLVLVQFWGVWEDTPEWCFPLVGLWWIGFAQFTYKVLPNGNKKKQKVDRKVLAHGFKELINVYKEMRKHRRLKTFLSSFFVYSMGIQTVMLMAVMYAKKELGVDQTVLISSVLIIQFVAIGGAYLFSWLSKKIGNIKTLMLGLIVWILGCVYAYLLKDPMQFYLLAGLIGLVMGGSQALSRSTYSKYLPETEDTASYFSFFDITEKIGIIIGMVVFGVLEGLVDMRVSVLSLVVFFVVGFLLLFRVPKESKIQQENV